MSDMAPPHLPTSTTSAAFPPAAAAPACTAAVFFYCCCWGLGRVSPWPAATACHVPRTAAANPPSHKLDAAAAVEAMEMLETMQSHPS